MTRAVPVLWPTQVFVDPPGQVYVDAPAAVAIEMGPGGSPSSPANGTSPGAKQP